MSFLSITIILSHSIIQAQQIVSVDVKTALLFELPKQSPIINAFPDLQFVKFSVPALENAFRHSGLGKPSKQRFHQEVTPLSMQGGLIQMLHCEAECYP